MLPSAVIKMEGGTDHDLRILELPSEEEEEREKSISVSGGAEPLKRNDPKTLDGDRKPSVEKDTNKKVCFALSSLSSAKFHGAEMLTVTVPQEESKSGSTERHAEGETVTEETEKEAAKEEMPETKKVSVCIYCWSLLIRSGEEANNTQCSLLIYQQRRKRKHSGDSDDEASASESDSDSDSDSNSNCSDKPAKQEEVEDKDEEEEEGEGEKCRIIFGIKRKSESHHR